MSKTLRGNLFGAFVVLLGCATGFAAYHISSGTGLLVGVAVALVGAAIIDPQVLRQGAADFKESASGVIESLPITISKKKDEP